MTEGTTIGDPVLVHGQWLRPMTVVERDMHWWCGGEGCRDCHGGDVWTEAHGYVCDRCGELAAGDVYDDEHGCLCAACDREMSAAYAAGRTE